MSMNKKGVLPIIIIVIVLILIIIIGVQVTEERKDCGGKPLFGSAKECTETQYCGSDYKCHDYPDSIETGRPSYLIPSIIIGIAIVVSAFILRGRKKIIEVKL